MSIEERDHQLQTALDTSPIAALIVNADGEIVRVNRKLELLFEYKNGELLGRSVEVLVPQDAREQHPELRRAFFEYPNPRSMGVGRDLHGVSKTGMKIPIEIGLNPIQTDSGLLVVATILDIRERKRHETRFRLALDAAPCAILMVKKSGHILLCNALTEEVFGYKREALIGQPIEKLIPKRLHRRHEVYRASYIQDPAPRSMGVGRELWGLRADGTEFPVEVALQPVSMTDQDVVISSVIDVSDRRAAEEEIKNKNAHLTKLNDELKAFAYSVSHDLKAPLSTISGMAECILDDAEAGRIDEIKRNAARIQSLSSRLSRLVEDVLSFARADRVERLFRRINVANAIQESTGKLAQLQKENGIHLEVDVDKTIEITTQELRLISIVDNLISNAYQYSDPEKSRREVRISARMNQGRLQVEIRDNGLGIPEPMHERVFRMFERAHSKKVDGSGLGLSLVKKHLEYLGGDIELRSTNTETIFSFHIDDQSHANADD